MEQTKLHKIQIYQFKDFDFDAFYEQYINEITPHEVIDPDTLSVFRPAKTMMTIAKSGAKDKTIIENKCRYLQDLVIRSGNRKDDDRTFSLNAEILKSIIGKEYKTMLELLVKMGYIELGDSKGGEGEHFYHKKGEYSTLYTLNDEKDVYLTPPFINLKIQEYKEKAIEELERWHDTYTKQPIIDLYGEDFYTSYLKSLNKIKIVDEQGLKDYIQQRIVEVKEKRIAEGKKESNQASLFYDYLYRELKTTHKTIYRIDDSHRIYHVLTNTKNEAKHYLNIDMSFDCRNSHPLLFNYFIFNKLNISLYKSYNISLYLKSIDILFPFSSSNTSFHNVGQYLRKLLNDNNIENEEIAKMKDDELEYIYKTTKGMFWDEINEKHPDMDRKDIKETLFGAVFYTKNPSNHKRDERAKDFKKQYPSVYEKISSWKSVKNRDEVVGFMDAHHWATDKGSKSLSIAMMSLEAEIFTTILKRLYSKRWNAIHIHDCIVIPKTSNKNQPTKEEVLAIMENVYRSYGLAPTFACK